MHLWSFFRHFLRHKRRLLAGFVTIPIGAGCDIALTLVIGGALNRLRDASDTEFLRGVFWSILAIALVRGVFRFLQRWWIVGVSRYVERDLKQELFDKLTGLSFAFHNRSRTGDITSRLTADVENIRMFLGPGMMYIAGALVLVPGSAIVLASIAPQLALTMLVPIALMAIAVRILVPRLHRLSMAVQESLADMSHHAQECFGGIRVIKGYGVESQQAGRFRVISEGNKKHQIALARARGLTDAFTHGAFDLTFLPIILVGGLGLIDRSLAAGDLFKFIDLTLKVFWPVIAVGWMAGMYPRALASAERLNELLEEESEIVDPDEPREREETAGELVFERVGYTYPDAPRPALTDVSVQVPARTTLGVVGPTGSGKSTLLNLIGRLFEARGEIRLDGVPIRELAISDLRGALAYVPQDSFLFSDRYRDNVAFGAGRDLTDEELADLVERACMTSDVAAFPDGADQMIGERGVTLSGGQRQRTCIARALAKDPSVLILDDCLSAVDTETEAQLIRNLHEARGERTMVIAAHRLSAVRDAERILVLDEGRVEAQGTHAELLESSRWYREAWDRQRARSELEELE
ncbi:MAG: ABC transporter ATP-binding protein [Planctomycetota bacterium]|nr:ABC transporter ATP-binding protein [Planctomycetota bacterium]